MHDGKPYLLFRHGDQSTCLEHFYQAEYKHRHPIFPLLLSIDCGIEHGVNRPALASGAFPNSLRNLASKEQILPRISVPEDDGNNEMRSLWCYGVSSFIKHLRITYNYLTSGMVLTHRLPSRQLGPVTQEGSCFHRIPEVLLDCIRARMWGMERACKKLSKIDPFG